MQAKLDPSFFYSRFDDERMLGPKTFLCSIKYIVGVSKLDTSQVSIRSLSRELKSYTREADPTWALIYKLSLNTI